MSSSEKTSLTEIERDLPTTRADVTRLRSLRSPGPVEQGPVDPGPVDPFVALQQLVDALPAAARQQRRTTAAGRPEFEL